MGFFDEYNLEDDLTDILQQGSDSRTREDAQRALKTARELRNYGLDPNEAAPRESLLYNVVDTLSTPMQWLQGVADAGLRGDLGDVGILGAAQRGADEDVSGSRLLDSAGFLQDAPWGRAIAGFGIDLFTDPVNWLTLGSGAVAKAGGKALSGSGVALKEGAFMRALESGGDVLQASDKIDSAFSSLSEYQKLAKSFEKLGDGARTEVAAKLTNLKGAFEPILGDAVNLADDIFEKPKLSIGLNVPFLGHILEPASASKAEALFADKGPVGASINALSKAYKPGRVKLLDFELNDKTIDILDQAKTFANDSVSQVMDLVDQVPVVGKAARGTEKLLKDTYTAFGRVVNRKLLIGDNAADMLTDYKAVAAGAQTQARDFALETFGDLAGDKDLLNEAFLTIDAFAKEALKEGVSSASPDAKSILDNINKFRLGLNSDEAIGPMAEVLERAGVEAAFQKRFDALLENPTVPENLKGALVRTRQAFDSVAQEDLANGILGGTVASYVPHKYLNLKEVKGVSGGAKAAFQKQRTFSSIDEAFEHQGLVADTNLISLLENRKRQSLILQAQKRYGTRLLMEEGLPQEVLTAVYKEAASDPNGAAAKLLQRKHFKLPGDDSLQKLGGEQAEYQKLVRDVADGKVAEFENFLHFQQRMAGEVPKDYRAPSAILGEMGKKVSYGGEEAFVPHELARAIDETFAAKDFVKEKLAGSALSSTFLDYFDTATKSFKKMMLYPWPAYWSQQALGGGFMTAMKGAEAMDPGLPLRTLNVLKGKAAIKSPNGVVYDTKTLERIGKQFGMNFGTDEYLSAISSVSGGDIDKLMASKKGIGALLKDGDPMTALSKVKDKAEFTFDGFFRWNHLIHRLEKGDTVSDAVRTTQDAFLNYRNMTPVESSVFRRFFMFYGFLSQSTKQSVSNLVLNPGAITSQVSGIRAISNFYQDPKNLVTLDEYDRRLLQTAQQQEQVMTPIGRDENGKVLMGRVGSAPINSVLQQFSVQAPRSLSVGEIWDTAKDSFTRTVQKQIAASNPLINTAFQQISGKNLYFDKPLNAEFLRRIPDFEKLADQISQYPAGSVPAAIVTSMDSFAKKFLDPVPNGKGSYIISPGKMAALSLIPGLSRAMQTAAPFTNDEIPSDMAWTRALSGVRIEDNDPSRSFLSDTRGRLEEMRSDYSVNRRKDARVRGEDY